MTDEELAVMRGRVANLNEIREVGPTDFSDLEPKQLASIALAYHEDVPALLTEVERLRARETQLLAIIDGMDKGVVYFVSNRAVAPDGTEYPIIVDFDSAFPTSEE